MKKRVLVPAFLLVIGISSWAAGAQVRLRLEPQSRLWLEGDSTLHSYSSTATVLAIAGQVSPIGTDRSAMSLAQTGAIKNLEVVVEVRGLKSGKRGLDKNMHQALRAGEHPNIVFRMSGYEIEPQHDNPGKPLIKAKGILSVAGREKEILLQGKIESDLSGVRIAGSKELRMTDFDIKPPTMFLGTLKTDDRVAVHYDLVLGVQDESGTETRRRQP